MNKTWESKIKKHQKQNCSFIINLRTNYYFERSKTMKKKMDRIHELEAEARALRREEKSFWNQIDKRIDEVTDYIESAHRKNSLYEDQASQSTEPNFY